ncbi:hypothetical protein GCM10010082_21910 [Kushneria pakistanensis]|uniref:DUF3750 domain-containing protein n=1 Tax=Kushneria pakistanensis TaxID=1508770 RepID=A0ABQ3FKI7_9GAMM|nr:DUF3750 domain-containing protein [Kushneria pakistanensis]GHC28204.1 hypothetical protein GCM10010082_21910 [Kushneria pakistanensis]
MMLIKGLAGIAALLALLLTGPAIVWWLGGIDTRTGWASAGRESAGLAPRAEAFDGAVVQLYGARAFAWRGAFAMHTWIAVKAAGASHYTTYEVQGWRQPTVRMRYGTPDREWFGQRPHLMADLRGDQATRAIAHIEQAVDEYPWPQRYRVFPGPNSNTFIAWLIRQVPELEVEMPSLALGKDYLIDGARPLGHFFGPAPSGTGYQISLYGLLGIMVARDEGLEFNLLGLVFGVDPLDLAIKLPGIGRIAPAPLYQSQHE